MPTERTMLCSICQEEVGADLPGWTQGDGGPVCPGCNQAVADGTEVYTQAASGFDYAVSLPPFWGAWGDHRGKN